MEVRDEKNLEQVSGGFEFVGRYKSIDPEKCVGCYACCGVCPAGAINEKNGKAYVNDACIGCTECETVCKHGAILW